MNSLSQTKIFGAIDKVYGVSKILNTNLDLKKYVVEQSQYDYLINIFKGYKYPLAKKIIEALSKGSIRPTLMGEPINTKDAPKILPMCIFSFMMNFDGKLTSFSDVSSRATYTRKETTGEIDFFKIYERDFYAFMQAAYVNKEFITKGNSYKFNAKFVLTSAEAFSYMLSRVIDSVYPTSANKSGMDILQFICAVYFLQNMFGFDRDKAMKNALTIKSIDKNIVINESRFYQRDTENLDMLGIKEKKIDGKIEKIYPIDVLMNVIPMEFPFIKEGNLSYRSILDKFTDFYGQNAVLALEHFFSFVCMLQMGILRVGLFNDGRIDKLANKFVEDLEKVMLSIN